jgi:hypothetical protein
MTVLNNTTQDLATTAGASGTEAIVTLQQQYDEIVEQLAVLRRQFAELSMRESELRAVLMRDTQLEPEIERLGKRIRTASTTPRVSTAIDSAPLHLEPFPYAIIDNLLPIKLYESLLRGIPPVALLANKPAGREHFAVPFELAPAYSQRVWSYLATELIPQVIVPRIVAKFRPTIDEWIARNWPDVDPASVELHGSEGRIMMRKRGYTIRPHRDPKWSFITCILYLAKPGDDERWGTQLYAVDDDQEAKNAAPYWIDQKQCRLVNDVNFLPNRLLVFLNSVGAHGAFIPEDAEPADLQRYIYQFRVGPTVGAISMLKAKLPEERQALWVGKARIDY